MKDVRVLFVTAPDAEVAERIARTLVEERLVACVNVIPAVRSIYRWQGRVETASEHLLVLKTARDVDAVVARIKAGHPYEVPEIIALPVTAGLPTYLGWVADEST